MVLLPEEMERVMGIEPTLAAWEAAVLPLNYTRTALSFYGGTKGPAINGPYSGKIIVISNRVVTTVGNGGAGPARILFVCPHLRKDSADQ